MQAARKRVGWLRLADAVEQPPAIGQNQSVVVDMPAEAAAYSARLYAALHELDNAGAEAIVVDLPPKGDAWLAVHDRLRRAAGPE